MSIFSKVPSENPDSFIDKQVSVDTIGKKTSNFDTAKMKVKCIVLVSTLKKFIKNVVVSTLDNYKITYRVPIKFLSDEDENGYVNVQLLLDENNLTLNVLNKSGEVISSGEYGYLEYRKSPTNGWISMRNGKPKMKSSENNKCFIKITKDEWVEKKENNELDEDLLYVFIDDEEEMY